MDVGHLTEQDMETAMEGVATNGRDAASPPPVLHPREAIHA
jgi:hypothetical protein